MMEFRKLVLGLLFELLFELFVLLLISIYNTDYVNFVVVII